MFFLYKQLTFLNGPGKFQCLCLVKACLLDAWFVSWGLFPYLVTVELAANVTFMQACLKKKICLMPFRRTVSFYSSEEQITINHSTIMLKAISSAWTHKRNYLSQIQRKSVQTVACSEFVQHHFQFLMLHKHLFLLQVHNSFE